MCVKAGTSGPVAQGGVVGTSKSANIASAKCYAVVVAETVVGSNAETENVATAFIDNQIVIDTDLGSVARKPENFACKYAQKDKILSLCSFASFGVYLRALSGASCDASKEVSVFRPRRFLERSASS